MMMDVTRIGRNQLYELKSCFYNTPAAVAACSFEGHQPFLIVAAILLSWAMSNK